MVEVIVSRLGRDSDTDSYVVVLQEKDGARLLPIWIGQSEAASIIEKVHGITRPRPLTHDLVRSILLGLGAPLRRVQITHVEERTYIAELHIERDGTIVTVDARPSDCIAIALRLDAPIYVAEELLVDATIDDALAEDDAPDLTEAGDSHLQASQPDAELSADQLKRYLELLRPEDFGKFNP
jgi:hypothetical protein